MTASTLSQPPPAEHTHDPVTSQRTGVLLLILADAAFVASLIFTYFYLRGLNTGGHWIPAGTSTLGIASGWIIAVVMVLSATAYRWAEQGIPAGDARRLQAGVSAAVVLLVVDLGLQVYRLASLPFQASTGSYASTVITMAGSHLVHLLITLVLGIAIWNRARRGLFHDHRAWHVRLVGYWWYWVAASAVLLAVTTSFTASPHVGA